MTWVALDDTHAKTAMVLATARAAPEAWEVVYEEGLRGQICPLGSTRARLLRLLRPRLVALGGSTLPGQRGQATGRPATASGAARASPS